MKISPVVLALLVGTACPNGVRAASPPEPTLAGLVAAPRLDPAAIARLHDRAVIAETEPALYARIEAIVQSHAPSRDKASALLISASLRWQDGEIASAAQAVESALKLAPDADGYGLEAELMDAAGSPGIAAEWYRKARDSEVDARRRASIDLKLALIDAMRRPAALADLVRARPALADRLALPLALSGQQRLALAVAQPPALGAAGVVKALRLAEWAIAAGDRASARSRSWQAFEAAANASDRRYALALLIESYRDADDMAGAATFLAGKPPTSDLLAARIDVLLELSRFDEAISLTRQSGDPDIRGRLLGILDLAGRDQASVAEYRRLISVDPHRVDAYSGLASTLVAQGDDAGALAAYRAFGVANRDRMDVLVAGARRMVATGFVEPAIAMVKEDEAVDPVAARRFLVDTYVEQGRRPEARQTLDAMLRNTPNDETLDFVADGYERLGDPGAALVQLRRMERPDAVPDYDRSLRMAELAERAGSPAEALSRWRALWQEATLPARRSYAEKQVVRLAQQTGRLEPLAEEIVARQAMATSVPRDVDLLLAIRLAQGDRAAAVAEIDRYAARSGAGEGARLQKLVELYTRMRDVPALDRTLRRLVAVDPANRDANLRRLILNVVRYGDEERPGADRIAGLDRLLAIMDERDAASAHAFKAAVYTRASLDAQALAELRVARATAPGDSGALLSLAEALRLSGRRGEAGALLEYDVLNATSKASFASAAGGLLDTLATSDAGVDSGPVLPRRATLLWMRRLVLERLVTDGEDGQLLGLLADIGQLLGDYDAQFRAFEASLASAGDQRGATLRQMVTLSSGSRGSDTVAGPAIGDAHRKLIYARRLIALRGSFPPDVYADVGGTLLAHGDKPGAERAFSMMGDMGGLVNVDAVKGRAYADQGFPALALVNDSRALAHDQGDLDLLLRTSVLREQQGQGDIAFVWYWRGLERLISRQPEKAAAASGDDGVDVDRYYQTLLEGLVLDWPSDPAAARTALTGIERLVTDALAGVDRASPGDLAQYRRLTLVVELVRRLADTHHDGGLATTFEARLSSLFARDPDYNRAVAYRRDLLGTPTGLAAGTDWPSRGLAVQARDGGNVMLVLALAIGRDDMDTVRVVTADALVGEVAWRDAMAHGASPTSLPPIFLSLLPTLMDRLPPDRFKEIVLASIEASSIRDDLYFDLFRSAPDRYARLEAMAGRPLLPDQQLLAMLIEHGNSPLDSSARAGRAWSGGPGLDRFSPDQRIALYAGLVTHMEQGGGESALAQTLVQSLFAKPLYAAQLATFAASLRRDVDFPREADQGGASALLLRLLLPDTPSANREVLLQAARAAADRYPSLRQLPDFLTAWFAGDRDRALVALYALGVAMPAGSPESETVGSMVEHRFPEARQREIDAFMAVESPDAAQVASFYQRFVFGHGDDTDQDRLIGYYRKLIAVAPDTLDYRLALARLYWEKGMLAPFAQLLNEYVATHRDDGDAAMTLTLADRLIDLEEEAMAAARASGVDPDDADGIVDILNRSATESGWPTLFGQVYKVYAQRHPDAVSVRAVAAREAVSGPDQSDDADEAAVRALVASQMAAPASVPGKLRALWRNGLAPDPVQRRLLLRALTTASATHDETGRTVAAIIARSDVTAELMRYANALDAQTRAVSQPLYDLIGRGLAAQGQADAASARSSAMLTGGGLDPNQLPMLTTAADHASSPLGAEQRQTLGDRLRTTPALAIGQRIQLARIFGRAGDAAVATALLDSALLQMLYPFTPLDDGGDASSIAAQIVAALGTWPDRQAMRDAYVELTRKVREQQPASGGGEAIVLPPLAGSETYGAHTAPAR